jgi:predicted ribosomally synthesized peptide with nif11-like leader
MSTQHVKAFYEKLSKDEAFRDQIKNAKSKEDCSRIVKAAGYDFTQQEFEDYTAELLEGDLSNDGLSEIGERELEAVQGGFALHNSSIQIYGSPPMKRLFLI